MKKTFYFLLFLVSSSFCLFDSYILVERISFSASVTLGILCIGIGIIFTLLWLEFREISFATALMLWAIPLLNSLEMSKEGKSGEEILFFVLSRIAIGIVFYISVYESVEIARNEFKEKRR